MSDGLHVVMLTSVPFPPDEGVGVYVLSLARRLSAAGHRVTILEADGTVVEVLESPGDHPVSTNCCFGGPDGRTLFAVDAGSPGHVYCWTGLPTPGLPLHTWPPRPPGA